MENEALYKNTGRQLASIMNGRDWYYKASFDKANRTSLDSKRGPGIENGIRWAKELKEEIPSIKLITDIHEPSQAEQLAKVFDAAQIPAFLCRQTDLLIAVGQHFDIINIKKGQWASPAQVTYSVEKVRSQNHEAEVWVTERGTFFGYDALAVDFAAVDELGQAFDKVLLDCTHSTQRHLGDHTGGSRSLAARLALAAPAFAYDGVFAEVHPDPDNAISDADSQIALADWGGLLIGHEQIEEIAQNLLGSDLAKE
jgi:2-dehydro-3-deoxyphosphooctonate aldolase (KDO 8-P synthase)